VALLVLALEKTKEEYGGYILEPLNAKMTHARLIERMKKNTSVNLVRSHGYEKGPSISSGLAYIEFPIYLGLHSYRTCFYSNQISDAVNAIDSIDDLRELSQGVGIGWADRRVLRHNGFRVVEATSVDSLIKMVAKNRIDLLCRSASQAFYDYQDNREINGFIYDRSFAIHYLMPVFFYTNKQNALLIERLRKGLLAAYEDGSLQALWERNFLETYEFQNLDKRKIFRLSNPDTKDFGFDFEQFLYGQH